ncbi:general stress protein CsbD [Mangrovibacterium lignilyticum]|uniref:general stress protein CsbD n=1 Tax=Mangrovibacterium lignilyticum TaxID=2668052 RepID=UPI0013D43784|nr:general stress protein CsbD [Mangrovibacterium lignilyticum]
MGIDLDQKKWSDIQIKLLRKYPQLTNADVIWRHETRDYLIRTIATGLGKTKNELEEIIEQL